MDQPGGDSDEYLELCGDPGEVLGDVSVVVIGHAGDTDAGGGVDGVIDDNPPCAVGVADAVREPGVRLFQNNPNPFRTLTENRFEVPDAGEGGKLDVRLSSFDVNGRLVHTLVDAPMTPGKKALDLDARSFGAGASGLFFYRLEAGATVTTSKLILVR